MPSAEIEAAFPHLNGLNAHITSERTPTYNCVAWAAGVTSVPWWPIEGAGYYWPPTVAREPSVGAFVAAFISIGYEPCDGTDHQQGYERIAIYAKNGMPTHVARQLQSGAWTSKLGDREDISHLSPGLLDGDLYGIVVAVMRRVMPEDPH